MLRNTSHSPVPREPPRDAFAGCATRARPATHRGVTPLVLAAIVLGGGVARATPPTAGGSPPPAGTLVVLNKGEATASLIDLAAGTVAATLPTGEGPHEVAVSPDGRWAVATCYGTADRPGRTLTVIDLRARRVTRTIALDPHRRPHGVAWLPDGRRVVVTAEASRAVLIVDPHAGRVLASIATDEEGSHMLAVSPDGVRAYVANIGGGSVTALDLRRRARLRTVRTGVGAEGIDVSPDGREVWVGNRGSDTVTVLDARTLEPKAAIPSGRFPIRVRFTADGRRVVVTHAQSSQVRVYDARTRAPLLTITVPLDPARVRPTLFGSRFPGSAVPIGVVVARDASRAWVAAAATDTILEIDLRRSAILRTLRAGREPDGMALAPAAER